MMFTGTSQQQDTRFSDKEKKLMKQMKFADCLNKRVDMSKVKLDVLRPWISKKITDILNIEDDVVVEFVYNQLEEEKFPCPKKLQINMTGFLNGRNARRFMGELWSLLLSAQESESGIPEEFIQQKKEEILKREEELKHEQQMRQHDHRRSGDRDRDSDRDRGDRRSNMDRSSEANSQRERELLLPPSTLSAIEQVRSQLSAKSRSSSVEENNLGSTAKDTPVEGDNTVSIATTQNRDRSKSLNSRSAAARAAAAKIRNRSPRKRSRERSAPRASSQERRSTSRRRNSMRDRDRRRYSRSPRRRSSDRGRRRSRSRERGGRQQQFSRRKSRSASLQKRRDSSKMRSRRRSRSKSQDRRRSPPKHSAITSPRRKRSISRNSDSAAAVNGHEKSEVIKQIPKTQEKRIEGRRGKTLSHSRSRSLDSRSSVDRKDNKPTKSLSRSRSVSKKSRDAVSPARSSKSSLRSSDISGPIKRRRRSGSRNISLSLSPDNRKDDFEIRKNKNSVQKKRHYRNNRDSTVSSVEKEMNKRLSPRPNDGRRREPLGRRMSPRGRSPRNDGGGRNQRSRSRRRSRSRNRSRSPLRRSRSPRRFNRRRTPLQPFRGRGGNNRGRMNQRRRSMSRGRGGGGGRFERRFSPQRRYSRDRRSSPMQNQQRKFSPMRRFSPQPLHQQRRSRDRRPNSRDRRPSSPLRGSSRERGGNFNRWDQPAKNIPRPKYRSSSESSNWQDQDDDVMQIKAPIHHIAPSRMSPAKNNGRRDRSLSYSEERFNREASSAAEKVYKGRDSIGRSSVEYTGPTFKTIDLSKEEKVVITRRSVNEKVMEEVKSKKPMKANIPKRSEGQCENYSISLSRTPSPFLKPHEREKAQKTIATVPSHKIEQKKKLIEATGANKKHNNDSDSSSSDSSGDSDDPKSSSLKKKSDSRQLSKKSKSSSSENETEDESDVEQSGKNTAKSPIKNQAATTSKINHRDMSVEDRRREMVADKRMNSFDISDQSESLKKSRPSFDVPTVSSTNTMKKVSSRGERKMSESSGESEDEESVGGSKSKQTSSRKRTSSISGLKKQHASSDSDNEPMSKKKRKKSKKAKRNTDDDSSSDSDAKKKKHKKHKKHSKKSKKHKKHKKKNKKAESNSSSDDDDEKIGNDNSDKSTLVSILPGGVNEDLEKQLRERALKSMKKMD